MSQGHPGTSSSYLLEPPHLFLAFPGFLGNKAAAPGLTPEPWLCSAPALQPRGGQEQQSPSPRMGAGVTSAPAREADVPAQGWCLGAAAAPC